MAGDALDGDVRRLRHGGRGGGNGDPLGYRPVRSEGDGTGGGGGGGGSGGAGGAGGGGEGGGGGGGGGGGCGGASGGWGDIGGDRGRDVTEHAFYLTPLDVRK